MKCWWYVSLSVFFLFGVARAWGQTGKPVVIPPSKPKEAPKAAPNPAHEKKKAILLVLQHQQEAWNKGRMEGFLEGYWKSDTLRMVTSRGVNYGWEKYKAQMYRNFPDSAAMGHLDYDVIHVELLGETDALVTGKWLQKADKKFKGGFFTFLFRKLKGKWIIVADHTS